MLDLSECLAVSHETDSYAINVADRHEKSTRASVTGWGGILSEVTQRFLLPYILCRKENIDWVFSSTKKVIFEIR